MNELHVKTATALTLRVEEARDILAAARTLDEVVELHRQAGALEHYARQHGAASDAATAAGEIAMHAARRLGQVCKELPQAKAGRKKRGEEISSEPEPISKSEQLERVGISKTQAHRYEKLADIPDDEWDRRVAGKRESLAKVVQGAGLDAHTAASEHDGDSWGTPPEWLEAARAVLDGIELDPATNAAAQKLVRAKRHYTKENNGLTQPWNADTLWLNPPYSSPLVGKFANRWCEVVEAGQVASALMLVNNATDTLWFHRALACSTAVCLSKGRIAFLGPDGKPVEGARQGQALFYFGPKLPLFRKRFADFGTVLLRAT